MPPRLPEGELLLEIGHVALAQGRVDEALVLMEGLAAVQPGLPHPRIGRALSLFMLGEQQQAIDDLYATIDAFPKAVFARSLLARFLKQVGDPGAESMARSVLERDPPAFVAAMAFEVLDEEPGYGSDNGSDNGVGRGAESGLYGGPNRGPSTVPGAGATGPLGQPPVATGPMQVPTPTGPPILFPPGHRGTRV